MRVAVGKLPGVDSVKVSLNQGYALVYLSRDNELSVEQVRSVIRNNGFSPKAARVKVRGRLERREGDLVLAVPPRGRIFRLTEAPEARNRFAEIASLGEGREVLVTGVVPETEKGFTGVPTLAVLEFTVLDSSPR
ncbi:MAG: hypothetical protein KatS3mg081_2505 [Gemmatimonadales bacterium]|nr:MAG: hypothetical protein KatS3mg081_2505 [Gemmatimonadales bacterium]